MCKDELGRRFRPTFGQLGLVRKQLSDSTMLFGTTATLSLDAEADIRVSAGFLSTTIVNRIPVYRPDVFIQMMPTCNPTGVYRQIAYTALAQGLASPTLELPKMLFFVESIRDTVNLRAQLASWFQSRGQRYQPANWNLSWPTY